MPTCNLGTGSPGAIVYKDARRWLHSDHAEINAVQEVTMPKGPKGEKRPADVIGAAVKVMRIATGQETDEKTDDGKDKAAQSLGKRGGKARAEKMSATERSKVAKKAAQARWKRPAKLKSD